MPKDELMIGEEVKIYCKGLRGRKGKRIAGYWLERQGKISDVKPGYLLVDNGQYKERFDIVEFRTRRYRMFKTSGAEVKFPPLPDKVAIDEELKRKTHEEYLNSPAGRGEKAAQERYKNGQGITWEKVSGLLEKGMGPDEIIQALGSSAWIIKGIITRHEKLMKEVEKDMGSNVNPKITKEQLYAEVKERGTGRNALNAIGGKYGLKASTLSFYLTEWGITKQLKDEGIVSVYRAHKKTDKKVPAPTEDPGKDKNQIEKEQNASCYESDSTQYIPEKEKSQVIYETISEGTPSAAISEPETKTLAEAEEAEGLAMDRDALRGKNPNERAIADAAKEISLTFTPEGMRLSTFVNESGVRKPKLRPKIVVGEDTGREYLFEKDGVSIANGGFVEWHKLEEFIGELQEIFYQHVSQMSA